MNKTNLIENQMKIKIGDFLKLPNFVDEFEKLKNDFYGAGVDSKKLLKVMPYWSMVVGKLSVLSKEYSDIIRENEKNIARLKHSVFALKNSDKPVHGFPLSSAEKGKSNSSHNINVAERKKEYVENIISEMKAILKLIDKEEYRKVASLILAHKKKR